MTTYVLAGGCFWCLDAVFRRLKGVTLSVCGYAGGTAATANYYAVAMGSTRHAEAVKMTFDEGRIPAQTILDIFFLIHDPTTKDRQGADVGPQYRSAMFYTDEGQKQEFEQAIERAALLWDNPIVTEIIPLDVFYEAEPEHQGYFDANPEQAYCSVVIAPKVIKARQAYGQWFGGSG